jgi:hypothetical protein
MKADIGGHDIFGRWGVESGESHVGFGGGGFSNDGGDADDWLGGGVEREPDREGQDQAPRGVSG